MKNGQTLKRVLIAVLAVELVVLAALATIVFALPVLNGSLAGLTGAGALPSSAAVGLASSSAEAHENDQLGAAADKAPTDAEVAAEQAEWLVRHRTPLIAQAGGVDVRSPILPADLTGVLFHQASFDYALAFTTELAEADYERVEAERSMRINHDQEEGEWLDAEALHLWRTTDETAMDTSIDVGAAAGTVARAPVTGTVVLVKDYQLYDEVPDIEIHIQPDGAPDLDCVLIHTTDPLVKAGDRVEAGLTELCHVRDIEKDLVDVQLSFFTPEGVGGNHIHVQVNDATYPDYRENKLKGAIKVG